MGSPADVSLVSKQDESLGSQLLQECSESALILSGKIKYINSFEFFGTKIFSFPHDIEDKLNYISSYPDKALKKLSEQELNKFNQFLCSSDTVCDQTIETLADVQASEDDLKKQCAPLGIGSLNKQSVPFSSFHDIIDEVCCIDIVDPTVTKIVSAIKSFFKNIANFLSSNKKVEMINDDESKTTRKKLLDKYSEQASEILDKIIKIDSFEFNGRTVLRFPNEVKDKLRVICKDTEIALKNLSYEQLESSYKRLDFLNGKIDEKIIQVIKRLQEKERELHKQGEPGSNLHEIGATILAMKIEDSIITRIKSFLSSIFNFNKSSSSTINSSPAFFSTRRSENGTEDCTETLNTSPSASPQCAVK